MSIDKQEEDGRARCMINNVDTLDKAIAEVANGLEIEVNDVAALPGLKAILSKDRNGKIKYILNQIIGIGMSALNWPEALALPIRIS